MGIRVDDDNHYHDDDDDDDAFSNSKERGPVTSGTPRTLS